MSRFDLEALLDELAAKIATKLRAASPASDAAVYLTANEVAARTSSTGAHWRKLAAGGAVPTRRDGRRLLFKWQDVEAYLDAPKKPDRSSVDELLAPRRAKASR
jgi:hypothetical protein